MTGPAEIDAALGFTKQPPSPSSKLPFANKKVRRSSPKPKGMSLWSNAEETFEMTFKVLLPGLGV